MSRIQIPGGGVGLDQVQAVKMQGGINKAQTILQFAIQVYLNRKEECPAFEDALNFAEGAIALWETKVVPKYVPQAQEKQE